MVGEGGFADQQPQAGGFLQFAFCAIGAAVARRACGSLRRRRRRSTAARRCRRCPTSTSPRQPGRRRCRWRPACRHWPQRYPARLSRGRRAALAGPTSARRSAVEVSEVVHDPELDEAVIAFANADFDAVRAGAAAAHRARRRALAARRDLARAVRPVPRHGPATAVREPGGRLRAAVRLVGAAVVFAAQAGGRRGGRGATPLERIAASRRWARSAGSAPSCSTSRPWRGCVRRRCRCLCPGSSTGAQLRGIDAEAAMQLSVLFRLWAGQELDMRWLAGDQLFAVLQEPRRPACAMPTRLTGRSAWTRCAWPTAPTSSTKRPSTTA